MSKKPTILLIPGAWHYPAGYSRMTQPLESAGYKVTGLTPKTLGNKGTFADDVNAIRDAAESELSSGNDIVAIMHSYGGLVGNEGLAGLGKKGDKPGIVHLVQMCDFVAPVGAHLIDMIGGKHSDWYTHGAENGEMHLKEDRMDAHLYNDMTLEDQKAMRREIAAQPEPSFYVRTTKAAYLDIPSTYLLCEQDKAIPAFAQQGMYDNAVKAGADMKLVKLDASHSPFMSMPDRIVEEVRKAAGEKV